MPEKHQESLDLFKNIYFNDEGKLVTSGYRKYDGEKEAYIDLAKNNFEGRSIIVGESAFTPRIIQECMKINGEESYKYYLTLDPQGRFDHHFSLDEYPPEAVSNDDIEALQSKRRIDVTNMTQNEIMKKVAEILQMSNEAIMRTFNIDRTHSTNVKIGLIVDDVINQYLEQLGSTGIKKVYGAERQMSTTTDKLGITQRILGDNRTTQIEITQVGTDGSRNVVDKITYLVLGRNEWDLEKIRIDIRGKKVTSELGQLILQTLEERFTGRQQEDIDAGQTGSEQILNFMKEQKLDGQDLALALAMANATKTGVLEAEAHIVYKKTRQNHNTQAK